MLLLKPEVFTQKEGVVTQACKASAGRDRNRRSPGHHCPDIIFETAGFRFVERSFLKQKVESSIKNTSS